MKQIDLQAKHYKRRDPDGVFRRRPDRKVMWLMVAAGAFWLTYLWSYRQEIDPQTLFLTGSGISLAIGLVLANLLRNVY